MIRLLSIIILNVFREKVVPIYPGISGSYNDILRIQFPAATILILIYKQGSRASFDNRGWLTQH